MKRQSAPIKLLQLVWDNACAATQHSWRIYNAALQNGLELAIRSGMKFGIDDFEYIDQNFRPGFWMGFGSDAGERWFSMAVLSDNISACLAWEKHVARKPMLFVNIRTDQGQDFHEPKRLFVGARFYWKEDVKVTKILTNSIRVCSYRKNKSGQYGQRVLHRYQISTQELKNAMKEHLRMKTGSKAMHARECPTCKAPRGTPCPQPGVKKVILYWMHPERLKKTQEVTL